MKSLAPQNQSLIIIGAAVIIVGLSAGYGWHLWHSHHSKEAKQSYADCTNDPGSHILETFPEMCVNPAGQHFTNPNQKLPNAN